jgi:hypothetical protein
MHIDDNLSFCVFGLRTDSDEICYSGDLTLHYRFISQFSMFNFIIIILLTKTYNNFKISQLPQEHILHFHIIINTVKLWDSIE